MKLIVNKPIRGYVNRGTEEEKVLIHANPGDKLEVVFDNTENKESKTIGHYICVPLKTSTKTIVEENLNFVVFPSQVFSVIEEKGKPSGNGTTYYYPDPNNDEVDDPFSTLLSEENDNSLF